MALAAHGPAYGLRLGSELTLRTGKVFNSGQVYTTLKRAERDLLVRQSGTTDDGLALFSATATGLEFIENWFLVPQQSFETMVFQVRLSLSLPGRRSAKLITAHLDAWQRIKSAADPVVPTSQAGAKADTLTALGLRAQALEAAAALEWLCLARDFDDSGFMLDLSRPKKGRRS